MDKDGNLKREESTFRGKISPDDPVHKPGAFIRSASEFRNVVSPDDPTYTPGKVCDTGGGDFS